MLVPVSSAIIKEDASGCGKAKLGPVQCHFLQYCIDTTGHFRLGEIRGSNAGLLATAEAI